MSDDEGFGPPLRGGGEGVDRTYTERWAGDVPSAPDHDGDGPVLRGRHRRVDARSAWRLLRRALVSLLVLAVVGAAGLAVYTSVNITRTPVAGLRSAATGMNVLVVGSDSRAGFTPEQLQALGTEAVDGQRTDTIFLLSVRGGRAAMLSFPRDLLIDGCDGTPGRINAAYSQGGPSCLVQAVTAETGVPITHYLEINLFGFARIVDALGGVPVYLSEPLVDAAAGIDLAAGCHVLDGPTAVGFVRARKVDSDLGRIARQQRFVKELVGRAADPSTLVNVPRLLRVAAAGGRSLTADEGLGLLELVQLARAGRGLAAAGLATYTVPVSDATVGGAAVLVPTADAERLYARFRDGSVLDIPPGTDPAAVQPADVSLSIRNGEGSPGLAGAAQSLLTARGFRVTGVGNTDPSDRTVVLHPQGQDAAARLVADQIAGAVTEASPEVDGIVLVLGAGVDLSAAPTAEAPAPDPDTAEAGAVGAGTVPDDCQV